MEGAFASLGDGSAASDDDLILLAKFLYVRSEHVDPDFIRRLSELCETRTAAVKVRVVALAERAGLPELEDILYRWKDKLSGDPEYRKLVESFELSKSKGLKIPLQTALLELETSFSYTHPRTEEETLFLIDEIISKYDGPRRGADFRRWYRANKDLLNPFRSLSGKRPRWIQEAQWPFGTSGKPLAFVGQIDFRKSEGVQEWHSYYIFTDLKTQEFRVIVQWM